MCIHTYIHTRTRYCIRGGKYLFLCDTFCVVAFKFVLCLLRGEMEAQLTERGKQQEKLCRRLEETDMERSE